MNSRYSWPVKLICGGILAVVLSVCYFGSWDSEAQAKSKQESPVGAVFQVEVAGRWSGFFKTCTGIGSNNDAVEAKMMGKGGQAIINKRPGLLHWHNITLTRALTSDTKLWAWRQEVVVGKVAGAQQKCTITLMDQGGKPVAVWELADAWPADLTVGTTGDTNIVTEEVTIAHEGVTRRQ